LTHFLYAVEAFSTMSLSKSQGINVISTPVELVQISWNLE